MTQKAMSPLPGGLIRCGRRCVPSSTDSKSGGRDVGAQPGLDPGNRVGADGADKLTKGST